MIGRLAMLTAAALLTSRAAMIGDQAYRSGREVVVVDASVTDGGVPVGDLGAGDFELRDNGVPQRIIDVTQETLPLDIKVAVDVSSSMTAADRRSVDVALERLSERLGPEDRLTLTTFSSSLTQGALRPMSSPADSTRVQGQGSAILDALLFAIVTAPVLDRRQFVLFMTDGADTGSYFDGRTVAATAQYANAPVTVVLVSDRAPRATEEVLRSATETTGGAMLKARSHDGLSREFLTALDQFRSSYVIRYSPEGVPGPGWHELTVKEKSGRYRVRARRGYWAAPARQVR